MKRFGQERIQVRKIENDGDLYLSEKEERCGELVVKEYILENERAG